mgnify:CR=1 FL=1
MPIGVIPSSKVEPSSEVYNIAFIVIKSTKPLNVLFKDAWAFVSLQSTAGFIAMTNGVPAYFTDNTLSNISKIENIENPIIDFRIFNNLAYGQWTIKEIETGEAWENILNNISY